VLDGTINKHSSNKLDRSAESLPHDSVKGKKTVSRINVQLNNST